MSVEAITWALAQPIKQSSMKFVLVVLANCADSCDFLAWPSIAYLAEATGQDRKTVIQNIERLREAGYLKDSGERKGSTKQVIVYRLTAPEEESQKRNSTENGTVPKFPANSTVFPAKESRFSVETVPKTGHGTVIEPSIEPSENQKTKAKFSALDFLIVAGVPEGVAEDWLALRKKKNLPPTHTALEGLLKKLREAGFTPEDGVRLCCERGWAGFDKSWLPEAKRQPVPAYQTPNEKAKAWADRLTGKTRHATDNHIIDITPANPLGLD